MFKIITRVNLLKIYFTTDRVGYRETKYQQTHMLLLLLIHNINMHLYILFIQRDTRYEQFQE